MIRFIKNLYAGGDGPSLLGRVLITGGFTASIFLYGVVFGILPFIIGALFLWAGNLDIKKKLGWTVIPLVLWIPIQYVLYGAISFLIW